MPSPVVLDFDRVLAPIAEDAPTGVFDKTARSAVLDARREASQLERIARFPPRDEEGNLLEEVKAPDWRNVLRLGREYLERQSKDLWVVAWTVEALCREQGFAGLRDGFRLARELCERYWAPPNVNGEAIPRDERFAGLALHPPVDEDDLEEGFLTPVLQLDGLNGSDAEGMLIAPINAIPLTNHGEFGELSIADYRLAQLEQGAVSEAEFERAASESPAGHFDTLLADATAALDEFQRLTDVLQARCRAVEVRIEDNGQTRVESAQDFTPSSTTIREALQDNIRLIRRFATPTADGDDPTDATTATTSAQGEATATGAGAGARAAAMTRDSAFREILRIADFFERNDPQSAVAFGLRQVVERGRKPLPELLAEVVDDSAVRESMFRLLGIPLPKND
jgi:type VI secretion system protein ImpA